MSNFSDKITLTIDMVTGKSANSPLKGIRDDIDQTDGAWGKLKTGASGAFDFVASNAAGLAVGAGAAIAGFAASAVGDFQDLAREVGSLRDSLGLSAEDASRWVEVADDLGIGADKLETSVGKMLRTAGSSPGTFEKLGVEIAYAKDGSVDANGTFLNVIDRLNGMKDPADRAAAAQQLLGKSWMDSAELIELGAEGVKERLDDVGDAKILTDDQIGQSRDFRDAMDDLNDRLDAVKLQLADGLVPVLTTVVEVVGPVIDGFTTLKERVEDLADTPVVGEFVKQWINPLHRLQQVLDVMPTDDEWHDMFFGEGADDIEASVLPELQAQLDAYADTAAKTSDVVGGLSNAFGEFAPTAQEAADIQKRAAEAAKEHADREKHLEDTMADVNAKVQEQVDKLNALHGEMVSAADATLAADEAQQRFIDSVYASTAAQNDNEASTTDKANAVKAERDAMIDAAKAAEAKTEADGRASGVTATGTQKIDAFNTSLLNNARYATPAAQQAITDYILEANGIPESESTDIRAAIAAGDFALAATLLAELSATRQAAVQAQATNVSATEQQLNQLARDRTATIRTNAAIGSSLGSNKVAAGGGDAKAGEAVWVGDKYGVNSPSAELFVPGVDGHIFNQDQLQNAGASFPGGGGGGGMTVNVYMAPGSDGRDVINTIKRYERVNGKGWRAS